MDYKATLNLPKTAFPMKANLPESEPKMLVWWEQFGIYKRLRQVATDRPLWILHDGPRLPGDHRARVWPLRRPGARPQGAQARPLVYALQNGARAGGGRVRGAADALGVGEVSAHVGAGGAPGEARRPPRVCGGLDDDAVD